MALTKTDSRSSLLDGNKRTRDASQFTSFRQRWMSDKQVGRTDTKTGLSSTRNTRVDSRDKGSSLFHLSSLRQKEAGLGNRTSAGVSGRSNFSLAERLSQTSYGRDQPLFQHRRTAASQLREIKQISTDGKIITKTSEKATLRQEIGTRLRAGSGSSSGSFLREKSIKPRAAVEKKDSKTGNVDQQKSSDVNRDKTSPITSRLRSEKYERSYADYLSRRQDAVIDSKSTESNHSRELKSELEQAERPSKASELLQRILSDKSRPFPSVPVVELDKADGEPSRSEEISDKDSSRDKITKSEGVLKEEIDVQEKTEGSFSRQRRGSSLAERIETKISETQGNLGNSETPSFERTREIASKIFEKLDSKKNIESIPAFQRYTESKVESSQVEEISPEFVNGSEGNATRKEYLVESSAVRETEKYLDERRDGLGVKIHKKKSINIPPAVSQIFEQRKVVQMEVKESGGEITAQETRLKSETVVESLRTENEVKGKRVEDGIGSESKMIKSKPISIPPAVSPKPKSPKSSIVLGSGEKITVAVELAKDDDKNEDVFGTPERSSSSIEEPAQMSVASLRNSLFGGSSSSLDKIMNRGMGGTLAGSPVLLRKHLMAERRQVVSSVEITQHGKTTMSMQQMSFRVETKSESDSAISDQDSQLLPTLYTRFEKPKKPKALPQSRVSRKAGLEPVTLQVKLNDDENS